MATIIDSLLVTLGLDSRDVDAKAPGVRSKLSSLEDAANKTEKGFSGLTGALESFGAVLGSVVGAAVLTSFAKDIIDTNTQLYYLSQNLGISGQKLNAWGLMAKQLGGSSASIQGFFSQIRGMYGQLITGQTPALLPFFARMGINYNQSPDKITEQLAEKFQPFDKGPNRWKAASFLSASGLPEDVINMVLQGPAWVKSHEKDLTALSPTDKQLQASAEMTQKIVSVEAAITKVGNNLLSSIMPLLKKAADSAYAILQWMLSHGKIVEAIAGAGIGLGALGGVLGIARMLTPIFGGLGVALAGVSAPVWGVVAAIGALSIAAYALYKNWDSVKSGIGKAWDWTKNEAGKAANAIAPAVSSVKDWASQGWSDIEKVIARGEGFFSSKSNIPKTAHNPGDILYGKFAVAHGATGYVTAQGGKKVAVFPDDATGYKAMHDLLNTKGYSGLTPEQQLSRWQTGSIANGIAGATSVPSSVSSNSSVTHSHVDNSKTVHVGTMNVNPGQQVSQSTNLGNGMDWMFAPQFNGGLA
jgi:hypothetical protein